MSNAHPRQTQHLEVTEAEDGLVVYDPRHDMVHHLNPTAALIFDLCDGTRSADMIGEVVREAFGLDQAPEPEVTEGLEDLATRKLIVWGTHETAE